MDAELLLTILTVLVTADIGSTQFRLARIERELAQKPDRGELESIRAEQTAMRADLTQIALAVGAGRPRATER